jgi:hypothetical protein
VLRLGIGEGGRFFRISFIESPERIAEAARRAGDVRRTMLAEHEAGAVTVKVGR